MNWDKYFISVADTVSKKSHCLSWKVGCVIVRDRQILSTGYNGPPAGYPHCDSSSSREDIFDRFALETQSVINLSITQDTADICPRRILGFESGKGLEYCPASHAEANAIVQAAKNGVNILNSVLYCAFKTVPCRECAKLIVNSGITKVVLSGVPVDYPQKGIRGKDILLGGGVEISMMTREAYPRESIFVEFNKNESDFIFLQAIRKAKLIGDNADVAEIGDTLGGQYAVDKLLGTWPKFNVGKDGGVDNIYKGKKWDAKQSPTFKNLGANYFKEDVYYISVYGTMPRFEIVGYIKGADASTLCVEKINTKTGHTFLCVDYMELLPFKEFVEEV